MAFVTGCASDPVVVLWHGGEAGPNVTGPVPAPSTTGTIEVDTTDHSADDTASIHVVTSNYFGEFWLVFDEPRDMSGYAGGKILFDLRGSDAYIAIADPTATTGGRSFVMATEVGYVVSDSFRPVVVPIGNLRGGADLSSIVRVEISPATESWVDTVRWSPN